MKIFRRQNIVYVAGKGIQTYPAEFKVMTKLPYLHYSDFSTRYCQCKNSFLEIKKSLKKLRL